MAATLELPTLSEDRKDQEDDDYLDAITGTGRYLSGNENSIDTENDDQAATCTTSLSKPIMKSGIRGASANMVNSIVGAGIIGIPYALRQSGLVAGLLLLLLVAFLTDKSLRIIVGLASFHPLLRNRHIETFEDLAGACFGKLGSNFILVNMFIMAYGAMLAYLLIIKDTVPSFLGVDDSEKNEKLYKNLIMAATSALIMLPLSIQRDMASLAVTSTFSISADVLLVCFIAGYAPIKETVENAGGFGKVLATDSVNPTLFIGLGILSTAMACQHSAFIVSGSLENKTMKRWSTVTGNSITISVILCAILGVTGYLGFLDETKADVLVNFDHDLPIAKFAKMLLAITMFFTYPMESFVARHVLVMLFHKGDMDGRDDPSHTGEDGYEAGGFLFLNRRQSWTLSIYIATLIPAFFFEDLGPVLSITGAVGGGCISYLAPGVIYLAVNGEAFLSSVSNLLQNKSRTMTNETLVTDSDLPVAGDSTQVMSASENAMGGIGLPIAGSRVMATNQSHEGPKPLWYYIGGFPLWCKIASTGKINITQMVDDNVTGEITNSNPQGNELDNEDTMVPSTSEYCTAIFFILFGVLSLVAGLTSNIWMQVTQN